MKERSDSTLGALPLHQQEQLIAWLIEERISCERAVDRVKDDFGVRTSLTSMYRFYRRHCAPRELLFARQAADALKESSEGLTENFDASSEQYLKQKFFELLANPERVNPKELIAFGQIVRQGQTLALKGRELEAKIAGSQVKFQQREKEIEQKERQIALELEKFQSQERKNAEARARLNQIVETKGGLTPETVSHIEEVLKLL